jgi:hypothetical protein
MTFNVTSMARNWENGVHPTYGFALLASHNYTDSSRKLPLPGLLQRRLPPPPRGRLAQLGAGGPERPQPAFTCFQRRPQFVSDIAQRGLFRRRRRRRLRVQPFLAERKQSDGTWAKIYEADGNVVSCCKSSAKIPPWLLANTATRCIALMGPTTHPGPFGITSR